MDEDEAAQDSRGRKMISPRSRPRILKPVVVVSISTLSTLLNHPHRKKRSAPDTEAREAREARDRAVEIYGDLAFERTKILPRRNEDEHSYAVTQRRLSASSRIDLSGVNLVEIPVDDVPDMITPQA